MSGVRPAAAAVLLRQRTTGVAQTVDLGARLGPALLGGDLVLLAGPLGAGKTAFVRGVARGMDVLGPVTSPTFVLARHHRPRRPGGLGLVHVDGFRLAGIDELDHLDLDTDLTHAVVVVEWGLGLAEPLAGAPLLVTLGRSPQEPPDVRTVEIRGTGQRWQRWAREVDLGAAEGCGGA